MLDIGQSKNGRSRARNLNRHLKRKHALDIYNEVEESDKKVEEPSVSLLLTQGKPPSDSSGIKKWNSYNCLERY